VCSRGHRNHVAYPDLVKALQRGCSTCGYCTGRTVLSGYNDLATKYPMVAAVWHPVFNDGVLPNQVLGGGSIEWWWTCDAGHSYKRQISTVIRGAKCPYCAGRQVWPGFNDMATRRPDLAAEWDEQLNGGVKASEVSATSARQYAWKNPTGGPPRFQSPYIRGRRH
jgi:hypothetical protein